MTAFTPVYRATVFEADGVTVLAPIGGAPHTDDFKVATASGVAGFKAYLDWPNGRRGRVDLLSRQTDTGSVSLKILDQRTTVGGDNDSRWVSAFVGDAEGQNHLSGKPVLIEESHDGGTSWRDYFTGRVRSIQTDGRLWLTLKIQDTANDMNRRVFGGFPHRDATNYVAPNLFPLGLTTAYGTWPGLSQAKATVETRTITNGGTYRVLALTGRSFIARFFYPHVDVITQTLYNALLYGFHNPAKGLRVRCTIKSGARSGESGHLLMVSPVGSSPGVHGVAWERRVDGNGNHRLTKIGIQELRDSAGTVLTGHPDYMVLPPIGEDVVFDLVPSGPNTATGYKNPILIDDLHPFQLVKDLLDGYYGRLEDGVVTGTFGDPSWTIPYDATEMSNLIADTSWGLGRFWVDETVEDMREFIESLGRSFGFGYYIDGSGDVRFLDLRRPTSSAGAPTVDSSDVFADGPAPAWVHTRDDAVTQVSIDYAFDTYTGLDAVPPSEKYPDLPPLSLVPIDQTLTIANFADPDLPDNEYKIKAVGIRGGLGNTTAAIESRLLKLIEELKGPFRAGSSQATVPLRREAGGFLSFTIGDLVILDVDELLDPSTNLRGGARLVRCHELTEDGPVIMAGFTDLGVNATSAVPTAGVLALTSGKELFSVNAPITVNASTEPVQVEYAVTSTGIGTRPVDASPLWTYATVVYSTSTPVLDGLPSGSRIWVRARTLPQDANDLKLPSAWVYPTANSIDTNTIGAPTGGASADLTSSSALVSWTNPQDDFGIEIVLDQAAAQMSYAILPAGSDEFLVEFLDASTAYTIKVRYTGPYGGFSPFLDIPFSTTGVVPVCPDLKGIGIVVGRPV